MTYPYRLPAAGLPPQLGGPVSAYGVPPGYGCTPSYACGFSPAYDGSQPLGFGGSMGAVSSSSSAYDQRLAQDRHSLQSSIGYQGHPHFGGAHSTRAPSYSQIQNYVSGAAGNGSWPGNSSSSGPWVGSAAHAGMLYHADEDSYSRQRWATPGRAGTPGRNAPTPPVPPPWAATPPSHDLDYSWGDPRTFPTSALKADFDFASASDDHLSAAGRAPPASSLGEGARSSWDACLNWEARNEDGTWQPWFPGVPFHGRPREEVHFVLGPYSYLAFFDTMDSGVELNLTTRVRRLLRRRAPDRARPSSRGPSADGAPAWMRNSSPGRAVDRARASSRGPSSLDAPAWMRNSSPGPQAVGSPAPARTYEQARAEHEELWSQVSAACGAEAAAANAQANEAYRELQKLRGSERSHPSTSRGTELPDVIPLGDGALGSDTIPLSDGPSRPSGTSVEVASTSTAQNRVGATEADRGPIGALEDLQLQVRRVEESVLEIDRALNSNLLAPGQARDQLAQLEARLSHLQCNGIDSVSCAGLAGSDAEEARARRKRLTQQTERLQSRLEAMFSRIKVMRQAHGQF